MSFSSQLVQFFSAGMLGVFAGAMLVEALVLVPYWRSLKPAEFLTWYAANGRRLLGFFGPLTWVTALLAIAAALVSWWAGHPGRWFALAAASLILLVVSSFYIYFEKANASFANAGLSHPEVGPALARWATWHWWRTGLSFAALAAALLAGWQPG